MLKYTYYIVTVSLYKHQAQIHLHIANKTECFSNKRWAWHHYQPFKTKVGCGYIEIMSAYKKLCTRV